MLGYLHNGPKEAFKVISDRHTLKNLCTRIKKARINANLSQEDLVSLSGVGLRTIRRVESGEGNFNALTLIAIARAINATDQIDALFPETISPLQIDQNQGKEKKRVLKLNAKSMPRLRLNVPGPTLISKESKTKKTNQDSGWVWEEDK